MSGEIAPTDPRPELDPEDKKAETEPAPAETPYDRLLRAEEEYLQDTGWTRDEGTSDEWSLEERPGEWGRYGLRHGHAVNVQKQYDRKLREWSRVRQATNMNPETVLAQLTDNDIARLLSYEKTTFSCYLDTDEFESAHEATETLRKLGLIRYYRRAGDQPGYVTFEITPLGYQVVALVDGEGP